MAGLFRRQCFLGALLTPRIDSVAETASTNDDVAALARAGASEGYWLRADRQTGGRGRLGRNWSSPPGNLYASTLILLRAGDPHAASLAFVAALAVYEAVSPLAGHRELRLKWPNDLLLDGAKCTGILLERFDDVVVLGIGVNLASAPQIEGRSTASFADGSDGPALDPAALMTDLAHCFTDALARWRTGGLAPILVEWGARAHPLGAALGVSLGPNDRLEGRYAGLAHDGALKLETGDGALREIRAADVELVKERS